MERQSSVFSGITDEAKAEQMGIGLGDNQARLIEVAKIVPNPMQPRRVFDDEKLASLADNIQGYGLIQPVVVKRRGESYIIVVGERRWRAAEIAGLRMIPAIIRDDDDGVSVEDLAVSENMQRENLNPVDEVFMIDGLFLRGKSVKEVMTLTSRKERHIKAVKKVAKFFQAAMAGGFVTYDALVTVCARFGIRTVEQAARIYNETGDLAVAVENLEKGNASTIAEAAEISAGEAEERLAAMEEESREITGGDSGAVSAARDVPAPTPYGEELSHADPGDAEQVHDPDPVVPSADASCPTEPQDAGPSHTGFDPLDPFASSGPSPETDAPPEEPGMKMEQESSPGEEQTDYNRERTTKSTQNGENSLTDTYGGAESTVENTFETGGFAPDDGYTPEAGSEPGTEEGKKVSGKLLLKHFTALRSQMEEISAVKDASFKVRENHREALAAVVKDVEFLMPDLAGAISAIESHLASKVKKQV